MKKTGTLLKEKRESSNLSLSEVALATKINPKVLTAIEKGDEANLPAKTFLKGFVRSYALFLKMDVEEVLRTFQEETGGAPVAREHEAYKTDPSPGATTSRRRVAEENSSGMRTAAVVVIVLLIGLIIGVRELIEKYQREKVVESAENIKVTPLVQPPLVGDANKAMPSPMLPGGPAVGTPSPSAENKPENKPEATLPVAGTPSAPPAPSAAATVTPPATTAAPPPPVKLPVTKPTEVRPPPPPPVVQAKPEVKPPEPKPEVKAMEPKPAETKTTDSAEPPKPALKGVKNEIILEALDKVDVKFQIKGETKRVSLAPTQVHTIHSDQPIVLDLSDGGAVNIILNGRDQGPPGALGQPKQIKIP